MLRLVTDEFVIQCVMDLGTIAANSNTTESKAERRKRIDMLAQKLKLPLKDLKYLE